MPDIHITQNRVEKLLTNLNPNKTTGPDGLPPRILKELSSQIAPILTKIVRMSLETGEIPDDWRTANVSPIFKKGQKYNPANYRPVSLTNASRFGPFPVRPLSRSASYQFGPLVYICHQVRGVVGDMAC